MLNLYIKFFTLKYLINYLSVLVLLSFLIWGFYFLFSGIVPDRTAQPGRPTTEAMPLVVAPLEPAAIAPPKLFISLSVAAEVAPDKVQSVLALDAQNCSPLSTSPRLPFIALDNSDTFNYEGSLCLELAPGEPTATAEEIDGTWFAEKGSDAPEFESLVKVVNYVNPLGQRHRLTLVAFTFCESADSGCHAGVVLKDLRDFDPISFNLPFKDGTIAKVYFQKK